MANATTPKIENMVPQCGNFINSSNEIHNIVDGYGALKVALPSSYDVQEGQNWAFSKQINIVSGGRAYVFLKTSSLVDTSIKNFFVRSDKAPISIHFFESPDYVFGAPTTPEIPQNRNRQTSQIATLEIYVQQPTINSDGTLLFLDGVLGTNQSVNATMVDNEWILKKDNAYLLTLDNNSGQLANVVIGFSWLEQNN